MRRRTTLIPAAAGALALLAAGIAPAQAVDPDDEVMTGLVSPLSVAASSSGIVFASQNFTGQISMAMPGGGDPITVYTNPDGHEIGGLSTDGTTLTFTETLQGGKKPVGKVWQMDQLGNTTEVADVWAYEKSKNPDGKTKYGIQGLSKSCVKSIPKKSREGIVSYKGALDSHPYSTVTLDGIVYVADAAANAVLAVDGGTVSTVATLPPVKAKVNKMMRKEYKLPKCTKNKTFKGEPVPTDIEAGPDGNLYVTTLGGALGEAMPVGGVHRIVPSTGQVTTLADDLMSPVGIAIGADGTSYISLLFPGLILKQTLGGAPEVFAEVPFPGDVDLVGTDLYATQTDLTNDGTTPPAGKVLHWATGAVG